MNNFDRMIAISELMMVHGQLTQDVLYSLKCKYGSDVMSEPKHQRAILLALMQANKGDSAPSVLARFELHLNN